MAGSGGIRSGGYWVPATLETDGCKSIYLEELRYGVYYRSVDQSVDSFEIYAQIDSTSVIDPYACDFSQDVRPTKHRIHFNAK